MEVGESKGKHGMDENSLKVHCQVNLSLLFVKLVEIFNMYPGVLSSGTLYIFSPQKVEFRKNRFSVSRD